MHGRIALGFWRGGQRAVGRGGSIPRMKKIQLGQSDLHVTPICLGTMTFGEQVDEPTSHAILSRSLERGVDFIDSTGLGCLVHGALIFQKQGARFEVLASEPVNAVIDRSWLKTLLAPPGA